MKSVLVTGGVRRIGAAIASRLATSGWRVFASTSAVRCRVPAPAGVEILEGFDLSRGGAAERLYDSASSLSGGRLDAIVNNAALFRGDRAALFAVNVESPVRLMELANDRGGAVVNILDAEILREDLKPASASGALYLETKLRLYEATMLFAAKSSASFRVNAVAPGPVLAPEGVREKAGRILAARPTCDDVARAVEFLLDVQSATGAVIPVDGGRTVA